MSLTRLRIRNFRNLAAVELQPASKLLEFTGPNGAGKTSILEAITLLARGRSFRSGPLSGLVGPESDQLQIFARTLDENQTAHQLGVERGGNGWAGRIDGEDAGSLADFGAYLPTVVLEPGSHALINGAPEERRRFLDWGTFHVKPGLVRAWQLYRRALQQRNKALKAEAPDAHLVEALEIQLAQSGEVIDQDRREYFELLKPIVHQFLETLSPQLADISLRYHRGWSGDAGLGDYYQSRRQRDMAMGVTGGGPHRCDLQMLQDGAAVKGRLSRGQEKVLAATLLLAQAQLMTDRGAGVVLLLDDLGSEFDQQHRQQVFELSCSLARQVWLTGVETLPEAAEAQRFHVKRGQVEPA